MKTAVGNGQWAVGRNGAGKLGWGRLAALKVVVVSASLFACASVMSGCELWGEGKTQSPFTNAPATGPEIVAQAKAAALEAERSAKAQADTMAANLRAEADQAAIDAARRKAAFDQAVASLDADTRVKLASLQAEYEISGQETAARLARMTADTERAVATLASTAAAKIDAAKASADAALAAIQRRTETLESLLGIATQAAGLVPGGGVAVPIIAGIGGLLLGGARKRKAADDAWDEATDAANAARDKADDLYVEGKRESELAAAMAALIGGAIKSTAALGGPANAEPANTTG